MDSFSKELLSTYDEPGLWKELGLLWRAGHRPCPHEAHSLLCQRHQSAGSMSDTENRLGHALSLLGTDLAAAGLWFQLILLAGSWFSKEFLLGEFKKSLILPSPSRYYFVHLEGEKYPSAVLGGKYLFSYSYVKPCFFPRAFWVTETSARVYSSQTLGWPLHLPSKLSCVHGAWQPPGWFF